MNVENVKYPILITDKGKTVAPLKKKVSQTQQSTNAFMANPTKEETEKATDKAINSGFTVGVKVIVKSEHKPDEPGEIVGFKPHYEKPFYRYNKPLVIDNLSVLRVKVTPSQYSGYTSAYAISELELV